MQNIVKRIRDRMDKQEEIRDEILEVSSKVIRECSSGMAALHRGDIDGVSEKLEEVEGEIARLNELSNSQTKFSHHGKLIAAHREYSELVLTKALIRNEDLLDFEDLKVKPEAYAQALPELIGEMRRYFLNSLREDKIEEANRIFEEMDKIFDLIEQFDYPDSILSGMRRKRDGARKSLEKSRSDLTRAVREKSLEDLLSHAEDIREGEA